MLPPCGPEVEHLGRVRKAAAVLLPGQVCPSLGVSTHRLDQLQWLPVICAHPQPGLGLQQKGASETSATPRGLDWQEQTVQQSTAKRNG